VAVLRGGGCCHAWGGVDDDVGLGIFFFEEDLDEQLLDACVDVPVDEAGVVAGDVVAEVLELDGLASAFGPAFALELAREDASRIQIQPVEALEQPRLEEVLGLRGSRCDGVDEHWVPVQREFARGLFRI